METILILVNVVVVVLLGVSVFAFWRVRKADQNVEKIAARIRARLDAHQTLVNVEACLAKGKTWQAMSEIGMDGDLFDELTLDEASQVFRVRVADLRRVAYGRG